MEHASTEKKDDLNYCFDLVAPVLVGIFIGSVNTFIKPAVDIAEGNSLQILFSKLTF